nr:unnamed protein product [Callosobruchus analis]
MSMVPWFFRDVMRPLRMLEREMERQMRYADDLFRFAPRINYDDVMGKDAVIQDKEKFQLKLDVQDFKPEEIVVKTINGNAIQIEAKHEEKHGKDQGFISRQLVRRFVLPKGHDIHNAVSSLSSDGVLTITAPRKPEAIEEERKIPITHENEDTTKIESK